MANTRSKEMEKLIRSLEEDAIINDVTDKNKAAASLNPPLPSDKEISQWKDLKVQMDVILGSTKLNLSKINQLKEGSIVVFEELANEYVDICMNDKKIAKGKIAAIDGYYAVQIIEILDKKERIKTVYS